MKEFIRIWVEPSKGFFQVHAIEGEGSSAVRRKLSRASSLVSLLGSVRPGSGWKLADRRTIGRVSSGAGTRGGSDGAGLRQALPQARQERRQRCGGDRRGDVAARYAVRRGQERRPASRADAAQDPRADDQAANDGRERAARPSLGVRLIAARGIHRIKDLLALAERDERLPEAAREATAMLAAEIQGLDGRIDGLEAKIAGASSPMTPAMSTNSRPSGRCRLGDGRVQSRSAGLPVGERLLRFARIDAQPTFERRQRKAWPHHQGWQSLPAHDAGGGLHLRCCGSPTNTRAPSPNGSWRCGPGNLNASSRSPSPTNSPGSPGRSAATGEAFRKELYFKA